MVEFIFNHKPVRKARFSIFRAIKCFLTSLYFFSWIYTELWHRVILIIIPTFKNLWDIPAHTAYNSLIIYNHVLYDVIEFWVWFKLFYRSDTIKSLTLIVNSRLTYLSTGNTPLIPKSSKTVVRYNMSVVYFAKYLLFKYL